MKIGPGQGGARIAGGLLAGCAACALLDAPAWCWSSLAAAALLCLSVLYPAAAPQGRRELWAELLAGAAVVTAGILLLFPAFLGERPITGDHTAHFMRSWHLKEVMLRRGEIFGWGNEWFAGHPVGYLYPFFGHMLVVLAHSIGFGAMNLSESYALIVWLVFVLAALAVYRAGAFAAGRSVGLAAALLFAVDLGLPEEHIGGWHTTLVLGVWPNALSIALSTLALAPLCRLLNGGGWREARSLALLWGAALLAHPVQLVNIPLVVCTALLVSAVLEPARLKQAAGFLLAGAICALMLSAAWVLPYLSALRFAYTLPESSPAAIARFGELMISGQGLGGMSPAVGTLAALGVVALLFSGRLPLILFGCLAVLLALAPLEEVRAVSARFLPGALHKRIEYSRFLALARPFWHIAAGYALYLLVRGAAGCGFAGECAARRRRRLLMAGLVAAPLVVIFASAWVAAVRGGAALLYLSAREQEPRAELAAFLNEKVRAGDGFFRVALFERVHEHRLIDLGTEVEAPLVKLGHTPAALYRYQFSMRFPLPDLLRVLNVRYVVCGEDKVDLLKGFNRLSPSPTYRFVRRFGDLSLFELLPWSRTRIWLIEGEGKFEIERFTDEEILFRALPGADGRVALGVSYFDRWHASRDGERLEITPESFPGVEKPVTSFITLPLKPGRYRVYFEKSLIDILSPYISLSTLIVLLLLPWAVRRTSGARSAGPGKL